MYTSDIQVCVSHTDNQGKLKLVSALDMMQDCTHNWLRSEPGFVGYMRANGLAMLVVSRQVDVVRLPEYGEKLEVRTSVYDRRKFFGYRNTCIYDEQNKPCLLSWCIGVFVVVQSGRPARVPQEVTDALTMDAPADMEYADKTITLPENGLQSLAPIPVRKFDIDLNQHMNNARYVQASAEYLPHPYPVSRVRMEFRAAAKLGDTLYPSIAEQNGAHIVMLADQNGKPYTITEFTGVAR